MQLERPRCLVVLVGLACVRYGNCVGLAGPNKAHRVVVRSEDVVHDAVAAMHLTQATLSSMRGNGAEGDAAELGQVADDLEKDDKADLKQLESRLKRLQSEYDSKVRQADAGEDKGYKAKLETIRNGIETAENQLAILCRDAEPKDDASNATSNGTGIDIDSTIVPYPGAIEQFGGEDTAQNLTFESVGASESMVRSIETAQATEGKRAVYRALTHLRGATITAYDGIAHNHLDNVESYAKNHKWREEHPLRTLAEEEADVPRWAFPTGGAAPSPARAPEASKLNESKADEDVE